MLIITFSNFLPTCLFGTTRLLIFAIFSFPHVWLALYVYLELKSMERVQGGIGWLDPKIDYESPSYLNNLTISFQIPEKKCDAYGHGVSHGYPHHWSEDATTMPNYSDLTIVNNRLI